MKKIPHLSISQLQLHRKNPRRWVLNYLENIRDPPSPHLEFGNEIHNLLEKILKKEDFVIPEKHWGFFNHWINENKEYIDKDWTVEEDFKVWLRPDLPPFKGRIDAYLYSDQILHVWDHKTVTDGYQETDNSLLSNWQLSLYSHVLDNNYCEECCLNMGFDSEKVPHSMIGHNQFFKTRDFRLYEFKQIKNRLTNKLLSDNINDIIKESEAVLKTALDYSNGGLCAVRHTPENQKWFGKTDPLWNCIIGKESIEECRSRIGTL